MSDPETQTPLIGGRPANNVPAAQGGNSSRAYKIAGITLLACVLIAGQVMTAYFLLSQRSDIQSLEEQSNKMNADMTRGRSVAVPVQMHLPMNSLPELMDDSVDEEASTGTPEKPAPSKLTDCQLEAAGLKAVQVPGFRPSCNKRGLYQAMQCFGRHCWCVNPVNGEVTPGSLQEGPVRCTVALLPGRMTKALTLPEVEE
ncbi:CD74 molecule, major histocompatibility complex, class II invariant chain b [Pagrus major]|uniref:CD74 molecule, major histocompatibility complex, class II invariant chain b n=1 Tax=Pagrus major TaxID=143350 RepID=UPI003CC8C943